MSGTSDILSDVRRLAVPLTGAGSFDAIVERARSRRIIAIGEASHGTHEFYTLRALLTRRLIEEAGVTWIGVEGDWPDCWRIDRWVRGLAGPAMDAREVLAGFSRWPTWMWANAEVADFLDWLRAHNLGRPESERVGFYGLDVYSLWDSLARTISWLAERQPDALPVAMKAWRCFAPFDEDPQRYAWETRLVPLSCEDDVVDLLVEVRRRAAADGDDAFDALQNAIVAADAEQYYRAMVRTDRGSWNIRDIHMVDTADRLTEHLGPRAKAAIWAHNTHVGDARATSMRHAGLLNVGQLLRERYGADHVLLVGMASYAGEVTAAQEWGAVEERMPVPAARPGSHEDVLHHAFDGAAVLDFGGGTGAGEAPWLSARAGHRAIGVVYDPAREEGNYVPTVMGRRYDALIWVEQTRALRPLHHETAPEENEFETAPSGY
ncbi:erythromycin esterase family protein [Microbacterium rhizosphaerae]|uniref:Erythromycin esterase family protein n=1 Tax=Microbacterium rhizosphaerae TaxID=1678237 RepID=A0ABZ0SKR1_9MICO|nr:erythromycin esterase family protein [Microbacterium rhizosphaerae]WPR88277.1 erythromycin esterase family protein [Microbacterium rhizosphaerae]